MKIKSIVFWLSLFVITAIIFISNSFDSSVMSTKQSIELVLMIVWLPALTLIIYSFIPNKKKIIELYLSLSLILMLLSTAAIASTMAFYIIKYGPSAGDLFYYLVTNYINLLIIGLCFLIGIYHLAFKNTEKTNKPSQQDKTPST